MLTVSRKHRRRIPLRRGRGAISGLFFCCAKCSIRAAGVSTRPALVTVRSFPHGSAATPEGVRLHCPSSLAPRRYQRRTPE
jgi:hypothetical protein